MRPLKYFILKAKYSLFKKLSTSAKIDFKFTDGSVAFSGKHQNTWYAKYSPILSLLLLVIIAPTISVYVGLFNEHHIHNTFLHGVVRVFSWSIMIFSMIAVIYLHLRGIFLEFTKNYVDRQIKKKFGSDVNAYIQKMDDGLLDLEKFNIVKEKEQLEQVLAPIEQVPQPIKKRVKI